MRGGGDGANGNSSLRAIAGRFDFFSFFLQYLGSLYVLVVDFNDGLGLVGASVL